MVGDLPAEEFEELKQTIRALGVLDPIVLYEGQVLDGWQRARAARELGLEVRTSIFNGSYEDAVDYAMAKHTRRSMTAGARVQLAIRLRSQDLAAPGRPEKGVTETGFLTTQSLAEAAGVSAATVSRVKRVERNAIPAVREALGSGKLEVAPADRIAALPKHAQEAALGAALDARDQVKKPRVRVKTVQPSVEASLAKAMGEISALLASNAELQDAVNTLVEENERLNDRLAALAAGETPTANDIQQGADHVAQMRKELAKMVMKVDYVNRVYEASQADCRELHQRVVSQLKFMRKLHKEGRNVPVAFCADVAAPPSLNVKYERQEPGEAAWQLSGTEPVRPWYEQQATRSSVVPPS